MLSLLEKKFSLLETWNRVPLRKQQTLEFSLFPKN